MGTKKRTNKSKNKQQLKKNKKNSIKQRNIKKINKRDNTEKGKKIKFSKRHPKLSLCIKIAIVLLLAFIVVGSGIVVGMIYGMWGQDFEINEKELILKGNSVIYDSEGNIKAELNGDESRKIIKLEDMAEYLPKAYVAIEDERFEQHSGVDFKRTLGAIGTFVLHRGDSSYGGSTITQQLVKNITDEKERSGIQGVTRKIKEWAKAFQIERMLSKNQILELYLNVLYVGGEGNLHGVELGAEYYFNKEAKDLDLVECAFLAGINSAPNGYNPYGEKGYEKDEKKKTKINNKTKVVLKKMLDLSYIKLDEYDEACKQVDEGLKFEKGKQSNKVYSYQTDAVISRVIEDFMKEKGWNREYATTYVYGGGLKIYTTEKPEVQEQIEKIMVDKASTYQRKSSKDKSVKSQAAMVVIDNETGYVVGMYGGLGEKIESRGLNRCTQSPRSTGSSIKPIADLLPGLEEGIITASTMYLDKQTEFENGTYKPKNDHGSYSGEMNLRTAIAKSHNIPFVKIMAEVTNPVATDYLKKMGITSLSDTKDIGLSLAIGGLHNGITTLEMAGAYATIANDGVYRTPLIYTKVVNNEGESELEPVQEKRDVCSEQTAYIIKDMLTSVVASGGTAPYCSISGMDVAAKTGTTNSDKDRWLCGFTNYYTGATWYGYDDPEEVHFDGNPAGQIWAATMKLLHKDKDNSDFEKPSGIVSVKVCSHTGLKATSKCSSTYNEIFSESNIPDSCDESGHYVEVCKETGLIATEYCPEIESRSYSYILPKERLKLWDTPKSYSKAPTERCTVHTAEAKKQNAEAPKITLIGEAKMNLNVGDSYVEKGANATDATDGDLTGKIQISGSVNTSKAGTYTITYKVKNSLEKETTTTRTITVRDKVENNKKPETTQNNTTKETNTSSSNTTNINGGGEKTNSTTDNSSEKNDTNKSE